MTAVKPPPYAPATDSEWARSIVARLRQLETSQTVRAGDWVLQTNDAGVLIASKPGLGSMTLAGDGSGPEVVAPDTRGNFVTAQDVTEAVTGETGDLSDLGTWLTEQWQKFLTPQSPLDWAKLLGQMPDWLMPSSIPLGALTNQDVNQLADPKFDLAIFSQSSGRWSSDTTVYRTSARSAKVTANGQSTFLRSNVIKARAGQIVTVTVHVAASALTGSGTDLLELNILPYTGTGTNAVVAGSPVTIQHSGVPIGSVSEWTATPGGSKGVTLTGSWVVTGSYDGVALMFGVTDNAVSGDTWWDDAVLTLSATTIPQGWITDLVNDGLTWTNGITTNTNWLEQISQIFNGEVVTPINTYVQNIKDWYADQVAERDANLTTLANQGNWWARLTLDVIIFCDLGHSYYPAGTTSDGPTTTSGGRRTWYSSLADFQLLFTNVTTGTGPALAASADVGTFAQNTQSTVVINQETMAQIQADVDALKTADASVAGAKFVSTAGPSGASWGSQWTVSATNGNIAPKSTIGLFDMTLAASSSINLKLTGQFTGGVTLTDDQIVSMVFQDRAQDMVGLNGPINTLKGRKDSAGNNYVYVRVQFTTVSLGYAVGGVEQTPWASTSMTVPAGALVELHCGDSVSHRNYQVKVNGIAVITYTESGTSSQMGASYRGGGQDQLASHGVANDTFQPARINQFKLQDSNVSAITYGTSARWYRSSTTAIAIAKGTATGLGSSVYDTEDYRSPDLGLATNGLQIWTPGRYRVTHACRISSLSGAWAALSGSTTGSVLQKTTAGPTTATQAQFGFTNQDIVQISGTYDFNAVGDGGVTELWAPGPSVSGSGTFYVLGEGNGVATYLTVSRIG